MAKIKITATIEEKTKEIGLKLSEKILGRKSLSALIDYLIRKQEREFIGGAKDITDPTFLDHLKGPTNSNSNRCAICGEGMGFSTPFYTQTDGTKVCHYCAREQL